MGLALRLACVLSAIGALATCGHAPKSERDPPVICGGTGRPHWVPPRPVPSDARTIAAVEEHGARYEVCPSKLEYLVTREGTREPTQRELHSLMMAFFDSTVAVATGWVGWPPTPNHSGVILHVQDDVITPEVVADRMESQAAELGAVVSLRVEVRPGARPQGRRCDFADQTCEPMPYEGSCVTDAHYDSRRKRAVLNVPQHGVSDRCADDGDCLIDGCGNECVPYDARASGPGICLRHTDWRNVYCGCVQDRCIWFRNE